MAQQLDLGLGNCGNAIAARRERAAAENALRKQTEALDEILRLLPHLDAAELRVVKIAIAEHEHPQSASGGALLADRDTLRQRLLEAFYIADALTNGEDYETSDHIKLIVLNAVTLGDPIRMRAALDAAWRLINNDDEVTSDGGIHEH
jgi:hypothetical protein